MPTLSFETIHWWTVLGSVVLNFVIGMLWYGPLFSKVWFKNSRWTEKTIAISTKDGMGFNFAGTFVQNIVGNVILAALLQAIHPNDWCELTVLLTSLWAAFILPTGLQSFLWEGDKWLYTVINQSNRLVTVLVPGILYYNVALN
jgi:hypothetical protein